MMPQRAMQKRVSPGVKNALDNAGNCKPNQRRTAVGNDGPNIPKT
jgi:hypothetical protein